MIMHAKGKVGISMFRHDLGHLRRDGRVVMFAHILELGAS